MDDSPKPCAAKFINPWVFHLQKLSLELSCPLCLSLFTRPVLLPCNHMFCGSCMPKSTQFACECSICKKPYFDQDLRPGLYMENIVNIYKNLDMTISSGRGAVLREFSQKESLDPESKSVKGLVEPFGEGGSVERMDVKLEFSGRRKMENEKKMENGSIKSQTLDQQLDDGLAPKNETTPLKIPLKNTPTLSSRDGTKDIDDVHGNHHRPTGSKKVSDRGKLNRARDNMEREKENDQSDSPSETNSGDLCYVRKPKRLKKMGNEDLKSVNSEPHSIGQLKPTSESLPANKFPCAFCQSSQISEITGPMLHYLKGKPVEQVESFNASVKHVHTRCILWTPRVYYDRETVMNLEKEISRSAKLKCASCGRKGAALGCFKESCPKSYHIPCAVEINEIRWDVKSFSMLCPRHISSKFPNEEFSDTEKNIELNKMHVGGSNDSYVGGVEGNSTMLCPKVASKNNIDLNKVFSQPSTFWLPSYTGSKNWVLCGSALSSDEKFLLVEFGHKVGIIVTELWRSSVTHVIASTDNDGVYVRTFKVLMAIANGRWVITINWVKACLEAMRSIEEEPYEIRVDNHGCCEGPKTGRLRALNNGPKVFRNLNFYIAGEFDCKKHVQELIFGGGGLECQTLEELMKNDADLGRILVIYDFDSPQGYDFGKQVLMKLKESRTSQTGCRMVPHIWVFDSIAACKLQKF